MSRDMKMIITVVSVMGIMFGGLIVQAIRQKQFDNSPEGKAIIAKKCRESCAYTARTAPQPEESLALCVRELCK